ncbi:MAG: septal ring lytic transglycosylase RlpA family protein [Leptolyngbyaceae cyanobacterium SL_7_1]|nr:septal ring lytic transglycosylase RlpA family protein [Leptolyngbyaceae cyanobacterium SL_7_1]
MNFIKSFWGVSLLSSITVVQPLVHLPAHASHLATHWSYDRTADSTDRGSSTKPLHRFLSQATSTVRSSQSNNAPPADSPERLNQAFNQVVDLPLPKITVIPQPPAPNQSLAVVANDAQCGSLTRRQSAADLPSGYEIRVNDRPVASVPTEQTATAFAQRLEAILSKPAFDPTTIQPAIVNDLPGGKAGQEVLFSVEQPVAEALKRNGEVVAIAWVNNLRTALNAAPLNLTDAQSRLHALADSPSAFRGVASWYGPRFHGRKTAMGEIFNQHALTAAHPSLPFDTYLKVTNLHNGQSIIVRVNDRGPYIKPRSLDLSRAAARCLGSETVGIVPYRAVIMQPAPTPEAVAQQTPVGASALIGLK